MYEICIRGWEKTHIFLFIFLGYFSLWSLISLMAIGYCYIFWQFRCSTIVEKVKHRSARFISTNYHYFVKYSDGDGDVVGSNYWTFPRDKFKIGQQVRVLVSPIDKNRFIIFDYPGSIFTLGIIFVVTIFVFVFLLLGKSCGL